MDSETIERETREEAGQIKSELHRLYDRVAELERSNVDIVRANDDLLDLANRAEFRAGLAESDARPYRECERRAYYEARERLRKAQDIGLRAFCLVDDIEERLGQIDEALAEIRIARALTVALLTPKAVSVARQCDALERLLVSERPVEVELAVGEEALPC